jgi:hypothetical protein
MTTKQQPARRCMRRVPIRVLACALALICGVGETAPSVLVRGVDTSGTGANRAETVLNTANVGAGKFGRLFSLPVDGQMYAQPLYAPGVAIPGDRSHNVLYLATMNNFVYAYDADQPGPPLWVFNAATVLAGATPVPFPVIAGTGADENLFGNVGIQSTPVIDPNSQTIYLVTRTLESTRQVFRLHALDISTGAEKFGGSVPITATYTVGGTTLNFDPSVHAQRLSLTLADGNVLLGFGSYGDNGQYYGWLMAYDAQTLTQTGVFVAVPTAGHGGAFWQSGRAPVVDQNGFVYAFTGNGFGANSYDGINNFGQTCVKLDPRQGLKLIDYFTPGNWVHLDAHDFDLGASGPVLLPGTAFLFGIGKDTQAYLINSANMGHLNGAVQQFKATAGETHGGPVVWQRAAARGGTLLFNWANNDRLKSWAFNGSTVSGPVQQGGGTALPPGGALALSANGDAAGTGIVWSFAVATGDSDNNQATGWLSAYNAENIGTQLWNSLSNRARDDVGLVSKFLPPTVVNGKVYVATASNQVVAYGLLPPAPGFIITAQPGKGYALGGTASFYLTAITTSGAAAAPNWSVAGLPGNSIATFATDAHGQTVMQVANLASVADGAYYLTVTAANGAVTAMQTVALQVVGSTPVTPIAATATSTFSSPFLASNAIDLNPATFWHSAVGPARSSLTIDLGSVMQVGALSYLPRQDGCAHGTYFKYEVWLSADKNTWTQAVANTFDYSLQTLACDGKSFPRPQTVGFAPQSARYVRFDELLDVGLNSMASVAEIQAFNNIPDQGHSAQLSGLSFPAGDVISGISVTGTVQLTSAAPAGGAVVALASSDPTNVSVPASVVVSSGRSSATFSAATLAGATGSVNVTATYGSDSKSAALTLHSSVVRSGWKLLFADSQQAAYPATNAFDGSTSTFWHTQYAGANPPPPHEIQIDLGAAQQLTGFVYVPRQDGCDNGTIKQYEFYVSADGVSWGSPVAAGNFNYGTASFPCGGAPALPSQAVYFGNVTARFVRLRALTEVTLKPWTSVAELNVLH